MNGLALTKTIKVRVEISSIENLTISTAQATIRRLMMFDCRCECGGPDLVLMFKLSLIFWDAASACSDGASLADRSDTVTPNTLISVSMAIGNCSSGCCALRRLSGDILSPVCFILVYTKVFEFGREIGCLLRPIFSRPACRVFLHLPKELSCLCRRVEALMKEYPE